MKFNQKHAHTPSLSFLKKMGICCSSSQHSFFKKINGLLTLESLKAHKSCQ